MSEFELRQNSAPLDEEFEEKLINETDLDKLDQLIEIKAQEILAELKEESQQGGDEQETAIESDTKIPDSNRIDFSEQNIAQYSTKELIELIETLMHNDANAEDITHLNQIHQNLETLIKQSDEKILILQTLINSYKEHNTSARERAEITKLEHKIDSLRTIQDTYQSLATLTEYIPGEKLDLENTSLEELVKHYRTYQIFIHDLGFDQSHPAFIHLKEIQNQYQAEISHIIESELVYEEYGLGKAEAKPLSIDMLDSLLIPDTEDPHFKLYLTRLLAQRNKTTQALPEGQDTLIKDDEKGKASEDFVTTELVKTPGVLATIDIPKFSVGDTRYKADTIAITLNPEIRDSVDYKDIQLAIYQLIQKFELVINDYKTTYGEESLIDPNDILIGDIIKISRDIKLDDIDTGNSENIALDALLQMHRIQIKTQSTAMTSALEDYKRSRNAVSPEKVGFLAKEYTPTGNSQPQAFNQTHFQIAAQHILDLPIQ